MRLQDPASTAADEALYDDLQRRTFGYFLHEFNSNTGLIADKTAPNWPASIAAVGFALSACPVGVERKLDRPSEPESRIRDLARRIWERVDWEWTLNGGLTLTHGWKPESGFLPYRWEGYDEALLLYTLALASPTHSGRSRTPRCASEGSTISRTAGGRRSSIRNSRSRTHSAMPCALYGTHCWGLSASDGPGETTLLVNGVERRYFDYVATYPVEQAGPCGWVSPWTHGLNQGPIVLRIENHRSGFFWDMMKRSPPIREGLIRAGFSGGWLSELHKP